MFDTPTLLIVLIVSNLLMAGAMWVAFAGRFRDGLGQWTFALVVQGVAWLLVTLQGLIPPLAAIAGANAFLAYCWSLQMSALLEFHKRPTPRWLLYGPILIAFLVFFIYVVEPRERLAYSGLAFGIAQLITGFVLLHYRIAAEHRTRWLLAGSYVLMACGLLWLGFTSWFEPEAILPTSGAPTAPGPALLAFYAVTIASSFAFILMHKERADRETYELATTDSLTGVYNRRTFKELAEPQLSRSRRAKLPVSLLMLDLDHFKRINDTYGHLAGDDVLKAFSMLVRNCLRKEDLLARYGGEEFVVLLPGSAQTAAAALAERIREEVAAKAFDANGHLVRVTVSVGVSSESGDTLPSLEAMLGRADEALYAAKDQGRNRVVVLPMQFEMKTAPFANALTASSGQPAP
ncbi:MAG TPA: GGDEF domain-containing protein [Burkholderiales bacterium]|nr:GGDEF domain-containing protein [Burkholderiales bacterium]